MTFGAVFVQLMRV